MSKNQLLFTSAIIVLSFSAMAHAGDLPPLAERYAAADQFQPGKIRDLIVDLDLRAHFVAGGKSVLYRHGKTGAGAIVLADAATGQGHDLVSEAVLTQKAGAAHPVHATPEDYDADKGMLKLSIDGKPYTYVVASGELKAVETPAGDPTPEAVSPDGKFKVVHNGYNLMLVEVATGRKVQLTTDGDYDHRYGMNYPMFADMVHADSATPPMPVSVEWSEDSKQVLTYRMDRNGSYIWHGIQWSPPGSQMPREFDYVYPTAGAQFVPQINPILVDVTQALAKGNGQPRALNVPAESLLWPGDPDLGWEKGKILYQWQKRGYGEVDEYEVDPVSGAVTTRVHEAVKPIVTVTSTSIRPAPEINGDLVISERSGWAQLYYVPRGSDPSGGKALTKGNWEVASIERVGDDGHILVVGNGREAGVNPYYRSLYGVTLDGTVRNLTPEPLDHEVMVADDGKTFIDKMSSPVTPTRTLLRSAVDGHIIAELGHADPSALLATGFTPPEPFDTLADDGKTHLYGMIWRPKNFDPQRSYPVIENVYAGPTTHIVPETYGMAVASGTYSTAQLGFVVVSIDGRGTSQRGQAFRLPAYQNIGEVGIDDHIWVMKAMKAKYAYLDLDRVGVYGHSAGGYDAVRFILRRPNFYKVAIGSSGIQDPRLDKAWWPEVSMGLADDATWERNSNVPIAGNLKGKLMIMHGDIDDNVPIAATLRMDAALIAANKPHELVIMPNRTHDTYTQYFFRKHYDFFVQNLLGETPPAP